MARTTQEKQHQQFRDFVFEIIWQSMPAAASLEKANSKLVDLAFEMARTERRFLETTALDIRLKYGIACLDLFRILFIMYQRGGYSLEKGQGFKTMWLYDMNEDVNQALFKALREIPPHEQTAAKIVKLMKAQGFAPIERVKLFDEDGKQIVHFAQGEQLKSLKERKRKQNDVYASRRKRQREYAIKNAQGSFNTNLMG